MINTLFSLTLLSSNPSQRCPFKKLMWLYTSTFLSSVKNLKIGNNIVISLSTDLKGHAIHLLTGKTNLAIQNPNHLYRA